jgi:hypothetical protein
MSLVFQYNFSSSNISNNTVYDNVTETYDATMINNPIPNSTGPNPCTPAMQFSSSNSQYLTLPSTETNTNGMSFAFWYYADSSNNNTWSRIFDFSNGSNSNNILIGFSGGGIGLSVYLGSSTPFQPTNIISNICFNQWNHIAWTLSYPEGWNLYVNGSLYTQYSNGTYPNSVTRSLCYLGKSAWNNPYLNGSIADFRFYNGVITGSTVSSIYESPNCTPLNLYPLINGDNNLYNPIYCTNLVPTNNNFITCQNCNFGDGIVTNTSTQSGEQNCLNACSSNDMCTSYSYDSSQSSNNCTQYSSFPTEMLGGVNNVNSGYSLNFGNDYNDLSSSKQGNVQSRCASQFLNNLFVNNNNVDFGSCVTTSNSSGITNFNVDPQCLFNIYETNDLNPTIINNATYNTNTQYTSPQSDTIIDNYQYKYDDYITEQIQKSNLSNKLEKEWLLKDSNKTYQQTLNQQNNTLKTDYINSIKDILDNDLTYNKNIDNAVSDGISTNYLSLSASNAIEGFENQNKRQGKIQKFLILFFILILIIFLFYIFKKK